MPLSYTTRRTSLKKKLLTAGALCLSGVLTEFNEIESLLCQEQNRNTHDIIGGGSRSVFFYLSYLNPLGQQSWPDGVVGYHVSGAAYELRHVV